MKLYNLTMPFSTLSTLAFYLFLIHLIPSATPLSFNFPKISKYQNKIVLANTDSQFTSEGLQLTPDNPTSNRTNKVGRATYIKQLHLWDSRTRKVNDFKTTFSFVIDSSGSEGYADGLTFFLAENNSVIVPGGALGLPVNANNPYDIPAARFVAVEFDTYGDNDWDPAQTGHHVGIDVNSLSSVTYEKWSSSVPLGVEYEATVAYNAASKDLSAVFTGSQNGTRVKQDALHYTVDLSTQLSEWVIFGFSGSTGSLFQKNTVKSWSFMNSTK